MAGYIGNKTVITTFQDGPGSLLDADTLDGVQGADKTNNTDLWARIGTEGSAGFKNLLMNGNFLISQRGTSFSGSPFNGYTVDRWRVDRNGTGATTAQVISATAYGDVYAFNVSGDAAAGELIDTKQRIESALVSPLVGKQVTLSFFAAATASAGILTAQVLLSTPNSLNSWAGGAAMVQTVNLTNIGVGAQKFSITFNALPSSVTNGLEVVFRIYSDALSTNSISIGSVQLEVGTISTPFEIPPIHIQDIVCKRYYERINMGWIANASAANMTTGQFCYFINKRTIPTVNLLSVVESSGNFGAIGVSPIGTRFARLYTRSNTASDSYYHGLYELDAEL